MGTPPESVERSGSESMASNARVLVSWWRLFLRFLYQVQCSTGITCTPTLGTGLPTYRRSQGTHASLLMALTALSCVDDLPTHVTSGACAPPPLNVPDNII